MLVDEVVRVIDLKTGQISSIPRLTKHSVKMVVYFIGNALKGDNEALMNVIVEANDERVADYVKGELLRKYMNANEYKLNGGTSNVQCKGTSE